MTLRAAQGWLGQRSIASTPVDRPWGGPGFKDWRESGIGRRCRSGIGFARRHVLFLPLARTFCWLPDTISFAEPVRGAHPPTGRAVRRGFRFVIFRANATLGAIPWRSHRIRDRWSRGTIPYPPTPHHDRAEADNDCDQDRHDGDSCIILKLPVTEWVSCCTTGFERHSPDRKLSRPAVSHTRTRKGRNSGHHPRLMTGVDRLSSPRGPGE
jgi:hypothetical protein